MMALLERLVREAGGSIVWMDTDGGCIVVTDAGGLVTCPGGEHRDEQDRECVWALSRAEIQAIRARFRALAEASGLPIPFERWEQTTDGLRLVGTSARAGVRELRSVFKLEDHNLADDGVFQDGLECYAVSVKNYMVSRRDQDGNPVPDQHSKFSAHAMGNLVSPVDPSTNDPAWIWQAWSWWLAGEEGRERADPTWLDYPVVHELVIAQPDDYRELRRLNARLTEEDRFRPFDALLVAHVCRDLLAKDGPARLAAFFEPDPGRWADLDWIDPEAGNTWGIKARPVAGSYRAWQRAPRTVFVESFRSYLEEHFTHPEPAAIGADGGACVRETRGVLRPMPIRVGGNELVGKETNWLREQRVGWRGGDKVRAAWTEPDEYLGQILPMLLSMRERELRARGVDPRLVRKLRRNPVRRPRRGTLERLKKAASPSEPDGPDPTTGPGGHGGMS